MISIPNEVKNLLLVDGVRKNIRIKFPNGERDDICNDSIVQNSVKFTESLCSQDELRFGLCESSVFECELVGIENIKGMSIFAQMEIDCSSLGETWCDENAQTSDDVDYPFYVLPYGAFIINSCQKQADMSHRKLVAYSVEITDQINAYQNKIIQKKVTSDSETNYSFNPYMLTMANYGRNMVDDIEYTEAEFWGDGAVTVSDTGTTFGTRQKLVCKVYNINYDSGDDNRLIYCEYDSIPKDVEVPDIYKGIMYSYPQIGFPNPRNIKTSIVKYIYSQKGESSLPLNYASVSIPYKYQIVDYSFGQETIREEITLRSTDTIACYNCTVPIDTVLSVPKTYDSEGNASVEITDIKSMLEGCVEMQGYFGKFNRNGNFDLIAPSAMSNLYPSETLYPSNNLFPQGMKGYSVPSTYTSAWFDDELSLPYGRVQAEYTYSWTESSKEKTEQRVMYLDLVEDYEDNPDKYQIYDFSDNYIIKNSKYTSSTVSEVSEMINSIASKISQIRYMPCDIDGIGMPWLEAGDTIALETTDGDLLKTIILSRTLSGEQYLTDNLSSN